MRYLIELNGNLWFSLLEEKIYDIGSDEKVSCHLEGALISSHHARIFYEKETWWIEDLGSKDGTFKDSVKLNARGKETLEDESSLSFGGREFLFSTNEPLKLSNEKDMLEPFELTSEQLWEEMGHSKQALFILEKLTTLLDLKMDAGQFIDGFASLLKHLFVPKALILSFGDDELHDGIELQDRYTLKILKEARFKGVSMAFSSLVKEEDQAYRALYAPLFLEELADGYLYLSASDEFVWDDEKFQLFSRLAHFAGRALTTFHILRRAEEDREVLHLNLVGIAPQMQTLKVNMLRYARQKIPAFIEGEQGVGKSRIARAIHQSSSRRQAPLMVLNAANFPKELFEVAMCGSVGNHLGDSQEQSRVGLFELADGGTLLIEEVGELPLGVQPTLLTFINTGRATSVGAEQPKSYDVRILMTSSTPLDELKQQGCFIPEFTKILEHHVLKVPSLKNRKEDIPQLFRAFLGRFGEDEGLPNCVASEEALALLKDYDWKENIRELRKIVSSCFYELDPAHPIVDEPLLKRVLDNCHSEYHNEAPSKLEQETMQLEHRLVQEALMAAGDDVVEAAKSLGISLVVLRKKMRNIGIG